MKKKLKSLVGEKFGRLTIIKQLDDFIGTDGHHRRRWLCQCICGGTTEACTAQLKNGDVRSCGCYQKETVIKSCTKHNGCYTRLYRIYYAMKQRCNNKNSQAYSYYGGRGIQICNEWLEKFENFRDWATKHGYSDTLSIDRIDVNGNYEPNNCRWATKKEQANNTRSNNYLTLNNETHTIAEWVEITGISNSTIWKRLKNNWSIEKTLTTPVKRKKE